MIDFIFQVDLSIIYIIHRRDFASPHDKSGTSTLPLGGKFYYTAAEANSAARLYCQREAEGIPADQVRHGERDALYRGGARDGSGGGGRDRFEVIVRRLQAGGSGGVRGESRGSVMVGMRAEDSRRRASWSESSGGSGGTGSRPRTREGAGRGVHEVAASVARNRLSFVGERRSGGAGGLRAVEEEEDSSGTEGSGGSPGGKRRKSLVLRLWGTLRRK